ncbi:alpha/beta hydrolase [Amycolatopsis sp. WGS_07]|uniref:alpha/beta hydrolase n=1 Tax=Amycolatopsis sp. WGS_07 TaxID=3076764 RepID=UPI003872EEFD
MSCASLRVPLDYAKPDGEQITLTVSGMGSLSSPHYLLVNPGGPGASGLGTEKLVFSQLPQEVAQQYAVFSFDPRGIGSSTPVSCGDTTKLTPHPASPYQGDLQQERNREGLARQIAAQCAENGKGLLPHLTTENAARDMDRIRAALGKDKIDYLGYSYGTKLGATYATLFPAHTGRMILDSVVDPTVTTYQTQFQQNPALQARAEQLFAWTAARDSTYHLGATAAAVKTAWNELRDKLAAQPADGKAGVSELDDLLSSAMYGDWAWPSLMQAVASHRGGDSTGLAIAAGQAQYAVDPGQLAYNCADAGWPRNWATWHADTAKSAKAAPLFAWLNSWYSAPCAFWRVPPSPEVPIGSVHVPPILLLQGKDDPATPLVGAQRMHRVLRGSSLLVDGGGNHAAYLNEPNPCIDGPAAHYLLTGELPKDGTCPPGGSEAAVPGG